MDFIAKVVQTVRKYSMLSGGERVLTGLSGGPDSVALLHVLDELKDTFNLTLHALYINHGLRPEEIPDEIELCRDLAESLGITFKVEEAGVKALSERDGLSIQEAARRLRYGAFEEYAHKMEADRIATGHHADDQAETVIMRLLRGSGPKGLSGIPPVRGRIIRPLIESERVEIIDYLKKNGFRYMVDTSNLKMKYQRNRMRQEILPLLREYNPNLTGTLCRTADIHREENKYLEVKVTESLMRVISRKGEESAELFLSPLQNMDKVILRRALMRIVEETRGLRGVGLEHIERIINLIFTGSSGSRVQLPGGIRAVKGYSTLTITSAKPERPGEYTLTLPGETVLKEAGILLISTIADKEPGSADGKSAAVFDLDKLQFPLTVRPRRAGDFFYPMGFGKRKKLQDYLVDEKVPRELRDSVPLLISGDDIIWVVGHRADDRYKAAGACNRVLRITVKLLR